MRFAIGLFYYIYLLPVLTTLSVVLPKIQFSTVDDLLDFLAESTIFLIPLLNWLPMWGMYSVRQEIIESLEIWSLFGIVVTIAGMIVKLPTSLPRFGLVVLQISAVGLVFTLVLYAVLRIGVEIVTGENSINSPIPAVALFATPIMFVLLYLTYVMARMARNRWKRCPSCSSYETKISGVRHWTTENDYLAESEHRTDRYNASGKFIGYEISKEYEPATEIVDHYESSLTCIKCGHSWTKSGVIPERQAFF